MLFQELTLVACYLEGSVSKKFRPIKGRMDMCLWVMRCGGSAHHLEHTVVRSDVSFKALNPEDSLGNECHSLAWLLAF